MIIKKGISAFLPAKEEETMLVQARVARNLADEVRAALDARKLTWNDFLSAACQSFLAEQAPKKQS